MRCGGVGGFSCSLEVILYTTLYTFFVRVCGVWKTYIIIFVENTQHITSLLVFWRGYLAGGAPETPRERCWCWLYCRHAHATASHGFNYACFVSRPENASRALPEAIKAHSRALMAFVLSLGLLYIVYDEYGGEEAPGDALKVET